MPNQLVLTCFNSVFWFGLLLRHEFNETPDISFLMKRWLGHKQSTVEWVCSALATRVGPVDINWPFPCFPYYLKTSPLSLPSVRQCQWFGDRGSMKSSLKTSVAPQRWWQLIPMGIWWGYGVSMVSITITSWQSKMIGMWYYWVIWVICKIALKSSILAGVELDALDSSGCLGLTKSSTIG